MFDGLSKEVLLDVMSEYDLYVKGLAKENNEVNVTWCPITMLEFYENNYGAIVKEREDRISKELEAN